MAPVLIGTLLTVSWPCTVEAAAPLCTSRAVNWREGLLVRIAHPAWGWQEARGVQWHRRRAVAPRQPREAPQNQPRPRGPGSVPVLPNSVGSAEGEKREDLCWQRQEEQPGDGWW